MPTRNRTAEREHKSFRQLLFWTPVQPVKRKGTAFSLRELTVGWYKQAQLWIWAHVDQRIWSQISNCWSFPKETSCFPIVSGAKRTFWDVLVPKRMSGVYPKPQQKAQGKKLRAKENAKLLRSVFISRGLISNCGSKGNLSVTQNAMPRYTWISYSPNLDDPF